MLVKRLLIHAAQSFDLLSTAKYIGTCSDTLVDYFHKVDVKAKFLFETRFRKGYFIK